MKKFHIVVILLLSVFSSGISQAQNFTKADTQNWNDIQVAIPINDRLDVLLLGTFRIGRDITNFVDERAGVGLSYKLNKYVTVAPNYQYIAMQPVPNRKSFEHRFTGAVTFQLPLEKFTLSDRNQFERRVRHPQVGATRYRNRLTVQHPLNLFGLKVQGFVADEVFYDWSVNDWVRNRFSVGGSHRFNKHFTLDIYYMRQNDGRTRPGDLNILGAIYRIRL